MLNTTRNTVRADVFNGGTREIDEAEIDAIRIPIGMPEASAATVEADLTAVVRLMDNKYAPTSRGGATTLGSESYFEPVQVGSPEVYTRWRRFPGGFVVFGDFRCGVARFTGYFKRFCDVWRF